MSKAAQTKIPFTPPFFYGWIIVVISGMGLFFSGPGQTYSISTFINAYIEEFDWSRSLISSLYSVATFLAGMCLFIVGRAVNRWGQRKVMFIVAVILGASCLWNSMAVTPVMLFMGFFMTRLFGQGAMTLVPVTLVSQWFVTYRGRAFSLMTVGTFAGSAFIPMINTWLITNWGIQEAWLFWGFLLCLFFAPLAYYITRNTPESVSLLPDNRVRQPLATESTEVYEENWTLKEAMRTRAFWLLLICASIPAMVNTGLVFHLISIFGSKGIDATFSAFVLSLMALTSFPVTFISGFINERYKTNHILAVVFMGQALTMLILVFTGNTGGAIAFGIIRGIVAGFESITLNTIWPNYFGRASIANIQGVTMTSTVIGSAFGPLPFGFAFDFFGGYTEIIWIMLLFPVIGCFFALISPKPVKKAIQN
ncbi:MFS transporter [Paenibacillus polymyxa]|uniref:MFS transporter n=1 Tax=Paenibacillus polymyxa TaxID=1406 RepID=UPI001BEADDC3|nr:MFS transporter [Paenibacillus polymyxa]MBT2285303.1 MFS transporter [Paenibacillus polymyxa]